MCSKSTLTETEILQRQEWISSFVRLVEDSEFDTRRVMRLNFQRRLKKVELDPESQKTLLNELGLFEEAQSVDKEDVEMSEGSGVKDVELSSDQIIGHQRTIRVNKNRRPTGQQFLSNSNQYLHIKSHLDLVSLEDLLSWKDFGFLIESGESSESHGILNPDVYNL